MIEEGAEIDGVLVKNFMPYVVAYPEFEAVLDQLRRLTALSYAQPGVDHVGVAISGRRRDRQAVDLELRVSMVAGDEGEIPRLVRCAALSPIVGARWKYSVSTIATTSGQGWRTHYLERSSMSGDIQQMLGKLSAELEDIAGRLAEDIAETIQVDS